MHASKLLVFDLDQTVYDCFDLMEGEDRTHVIYKSWLLFRKNVKGIVGYKENTKRCILVLRPNIEMYLTALKIKGYQLTFFTKSTKSYADKMLNKAQLFRYFTYEKRFYYEDLEGESFKNLTKFGRSIKEVLLIDDLKQNIVHKTPVRDKEGVVSLEFLNGIHVPAFRAREFLAMNDLMSPELVAKKANTVFHFFMLRLLKFNQTKDIRQFNVDLNNKILKKKHYIVDHDLP
jgi:predicted phosphatase